MDIEYFFDKATLWEINNIIENIPYLDRNLWESQRIIAYISAQAASKKRIEMRDIIKFKWDDNILEAAASGDIEISNEEIERLKKLAEKWQG